MAAFARLLAELRPERVLEVLLPRIERAPAFAARLSVHVDARRVVLEDALRSLDRVEPRVRPRIRHVVLQQDRAPPRRLDQRRVQVAGDVLLLPLRVGAVLHRLIAVQGEPAFLGAHRHQVLEAVAPVNVEVPGYRSEAMGGIQVGVVARVPGAAPQPFVAVLEQDVAQVVQVRGRAVQRLAEHAGVHQAIHQHLVVAVVAVLELQAVPAVLLARVDERPQVLERHRERAFARYVLPGLEGGEHHRHVPLPRGGRVDEVDVVALHQLFEGVVAVGMERGHRCSGVGDHLGGLLRLLGHVVAQRGDAHAWAAQKFMNEGPPAEPRADDGDAHRLVPLEGDALHGGAGQRRGGRGVRLRRRRHRLGDGRRKCARRAQGSAGESRGLQQIAAAQPRAIIRCGHGEPPIARPGKVTGSRCGARGGLREKGSCKLYAVRRTPSAVRRS